MNQIYLDHAATTPPLPEVCDTMISYMKSEWGNPSSLYDFSDEPRRAVLDARAHTAALIHADPKRIFFTSGGSESDSWALIGCARLLRCKGNHIIVSAIEHHAILHAAAFLEDEGFDAVFIGSGAGLPRFMGIPGENANEVFSANEYLTRSNLMKAFKDEYDTPIARFKKVAVVGGGNVAMDAARTALRLGAETHIVYRRSEEELPARAEEVHHAKEEGIIFDLLTNPTEILTDDKGNVTGMKCIKMELGEPDASGRRKPVEIPGSEFVMELDAVIMSLGTSPNPLISSTTKGLDINKRKCIVAEEETGKTSKEGVYAGGDAVTGAATVILAMGAGKAGAKGIDEFLSNN